jgi:hypothetical protein
MSTANSAAETMKSIVSGLENYLVLFNCGDVTFDLSASIPLSFLNIISIVSPIKHISSISNVRFPLLLLQL